MAKRGRPALVPHVLIRLAVGLALVAGLLTVAAAPASAVSCPYDTLARTLSVSPTAADTNLTFRANGPYLEVEDVFCALLSEVNTVNINVASRPAIGIEFDQRNGPLGPGYLVESDGASDIEFSIAGMTASTSVTVFGTTGNDVMRVGQYVNKFAGTTTGQINMNAAAETSADVDVSFPSAPGSITLQGLEGDDTLSGTGVGTALTGTTPVKLTLDGGLGSSTLAGGNGDDSLRFREEAVNDGADIMTGGLGVDGVQAVTMNGPTSGSITLDGVANDGGHCPGAGCNGDNVGNDIENVAGSSSSETIVGNAAPQSLTGGGGFDVLSGAGGSDRLNCMSGKASRGGACDTTMVFPACQVVQGGKGSDLASFMSLGPHSVTVSLDGVANDGFSGAVMNVKGDVENIIGTTLSDQIIGSERANMLDGGPGDDALYGFGGADTLIPGVGSDSVSGGTEVDRLSYETFPVSVIINGLEKTATSQAGNDTFGGIEAYIGSPNADSVIGSNAGDRIEGGLGNDGLQGRGGADTVLGGDGDDSIDGGDGTDVCDQGLGTGTVINCEG